MRYLFIGGSRDGQYIVLSDGPLFVDLPIEVIKSNETERYYQTKFKGKERDLCFYRHSELTENEASNMLLWGYLGTPQNAF